MSSKKLFSKFLAKSLLITSVVSCFSCSFVFAMEKSVSSTEKQDNEVLDDIRKAVKSVINDLKKQHPLENTLDVLPMSSASIHRLAFIDDRRALKSQVLRLLKSNTGRKYTNPDAAISRLNQKDALDLLGKIAEECQDQLKQNSAK